MVHGISSAPSGRCTVWQCTMCGPDSYEYSAPEMRSGDMYAAVPTCHIREVG